MLPQTKPTLEQSIALDGFISMFPAYNKLGAKRELVGIYIERMGACSNPADRAFYREKIETAIFGL